MAGKIQIYITGKSNLLYCQVSGKDKKEKPRGVRWYFYIFQSQKRSCTDFTTHKSFLLINAGGQIYRLRAIIEKYA